MISPHGVRSHGRHDHAGGEVQGVVEFSIWCFRFGFYTCGMSLMRVCGRLATSVVTMPSLAKHVSHVVLVWSSVDFVMFYDMFFMRSRLKILFCGSHLFSSFRLSGGIVRRICALW